MKKISLENKKRLVCLLFNVVGTKKYLDIYFSVLKFFNDIRKF